MPSMPVGLTRDLPPKRVMRAHVGARDVVVWRAADGAIAAWDNRCPHRGMSLSHGFVRGNTLACLYHGWHYERSGTCSLIPAHPDLVPPETIHTIRFDVVEQDGVIWVNTDGPAQADAPAQPLDPLRSLIMAASPQQVMDACRETPFEGDMPRPAAPGLFHAGAATIAVLCNPTAPAQTQVSVLVGPGLSLERRRALSRWCEAVRRSAETMAETGA